MEKKANWSGFTRKDRMEIIDRVEEAVRGAGGWITDHKMFSNSSINLIIEIPQRKAIVLFEQLSALIQMNTPEPDQHPAAWSGDLDGIVFLHLNFIHDQPYIEIEIPEVPG